MLLGDLIYNDSIDLNCEYKIYEYDDYYNDGELIHDTVVDGHCKLLDSLLDREITYITIRNNQLIIEIC